MNRTGRRGGTLSWPVTKQTLEPKGKVSIKMRMAHAEENEMRVAVPEGWPSGKREKDTEGEKQHNMYGLVPGFDSYVTIIEVCYRKWQLPICVENISLCIIMSPVWAISFFPVLASKTLEVAFQCLCPHVLAGPSHDFKTIWGPHEELRFPSNSCVGATSRVCSGDNNFLVLYSACNSGRKKYMHWRVVVQIFQAEHEKLWLKHCCVQVAYALRDLEPADSWGLLVTSIPACKWLEKTHPQCKNTPPSSLTAGCQNVTVWFLYFLLIFGHFHKYIMFTFLGDFFIKIDIVDLGLKRAASGKDVCRSLPFLSCSG